MANRNLLKDANNTLQASVTKTADFDGTAITTLVPELVYNFVVYATAIDTTTGDETYDINIGFSTDSGSTYKFLTQFKVTAVGTQKRLIEVPTGTTHVRASIDVTGTTPSLTYSVYAEA